MSGADRASGLALIRAPIGRMIEDLISELRRSAGWELETDAHAVAEKLAALDSDAAVAAMVTLLEQLDQIDLAEDSGDEADELWRTRQALKHGLVRCGARAIAPLRPLIARAPSAAGLAALAILATLGDAEAAPTAIAWVELGELGALVPLGILAPLGGVELLARTIATEREVNQG